MGAKPRTQDPWAARFEDELKGDGRAQRIFARLVSKGVDQRRLVLLLQAVADPNVGSRLQRIIEDGVPPGKARNAEVWLFPSKQSAQRLAKSLRDTALEIRRFWLHSFLCAFPYCKTALDTADILDQQAKALDEVQWNVITKRLGYKAFWRQIPLALLCVELNVPDDISYVDLSQLLGVALRAHFHPDEDSRFSPDALRRRYERFHKRQTSRGDTLALVKAFLKYIPPSD